MRLDHLLSKEKFFFCFCANPFVLLLLVVGVGVGGTLAMVCCLLVWVVGVRCWVLRGRLLCVVGFLVGMAGVCCCVWWVLVVCVF